MLSARQQGSTIPLPTGRFLIGREEDCHLRPNSELVSRHHCVFTHDEYTVRVRDLGSTNGTFVNGNRVRGTAVLNSGDRVTVGKLEFEVVIGDETAATAAAPDTESTPAAADETAMIHGADTPTEVPVYTGPAAAAVPVSMGDTAMFQAMPPGYPAMPGYAPQYAPQPYGYPAYPQPQMYPGYYMPNMGYPLQGGYPAAAPTAAPAAAAPEDDVLDVKLPDPSTTGAKPPEPKAQPGGGGMNGGNVPDQAASIIKNYLQRRPAT
ncbi:MAG: FHA domain-containing protein [Planctomycetaceae bacterium]|nr:FHA domain-containing protein [Planctomycetaceae bacterium]